MRRFELSFRPMSDRGFERFPAVFIKVHERNTLGVYYQAIANQYGDGRWYFRSDYGLQFNEDEVDGWMDYIGEFRGIMDLIPIEHRVDGRLAQTFLEIQDIDGEAHELHTVSKQEV